MWLSISLPSLSSNSTLLPTRCEESLISGVLLPFLRLLLLLNYSMENSALSSSEDSLISASLSQIICIFTLKNLNFNN